MRGRRGLGPTEAAIALARYAELAVEAVDGGLDAVHSVTDLKTGTCTFGVLRNAAYYDLSDLVQRFHALHPGVKVRLVGLNSALVAESVSSGEIEAGLVVLPVDEAGLDVRPLARDEVVYVSATRRTADGPVTIDEMCAAKLVLYDAYAGWRDPTRRQLRDRAALAGLTIDPAIEVEHVETALALVATGSADTIVSRRIAEGPAFPSGLTVTSFDDPLYDTIALVQRRGAHLSTATRRIVELAVASLRTAALTDLQDRPPRPARTGT
ncbi:LysR family transcriptional regulator substrate-binding protein [Microbacterium sp. SORGH_AS_0344]|uniref:LysR family transcriptional regulator substrate-binding protein n=1 Tax=Microbacterium sp. SORGH_AS_0344 TaxID=3041767 RepID=UPI00277FE00B|nr:LysR family transcriptional regulator substrate-binding protein [Microbacterium sp. SORGH_AS_0344]MDQ1082478.1 DNA-binding transcriptional LysR family regulator [Microbacterium sp. SORGH_AS_0344]